MLLLTAVVMLSAAQRYAHDRGDHWPVITGSFFFVSAGTFGSWACAVFAKVGGGIPEMREDRPTNKENMQDQLTIDITILHVAGSNKIRVHFPKRTKRLWKALTGKTRYYLATPEVQDFILQENPRVLGEWILAQKVLERLSFMRGPHQLSFDEANNVLNLIIGATSYWFGIGDRWEDAEAMLVTAAQVAQFELEPLKTVGSASRKKKGQAIECYEDIRTKIGTEPNWFSVHDIYCWWRKLNRCRSKDLDVLELKRKLDVVCRPFRLVLEKF